MSIRIKDEIFPTVEEWYMSASAGLTVKIRIRDRELRLLATGELIEDHMLDAVHDLWDRYIIYDGWAYTATGEVIRYIETGSEEDLRKAAASWEEDEEAERALNEYEAEHGADGRLTVGRGARAW